VSKNNTGSLPLRGILPVIIQKSILDFYRAMLFVSAVFDVARCLLAVCLPICIELHVHCIHIAEDIVKLIYLPGSPIILVFGVQHRYPIPRGTPSAGCKKIQGDRKIFDVRLKSPFISKAV